eukprot:scaffold3233_cov178-Amphora_coffeaeformis.AAC.5
MMRRSTTTAPACPCPSYSSSSSSSSSPASSVDDGHYENLAFETAELAHHNHHATTKPSAMSNKRSPQHRGRDRKPNGKAASSWLICCALTIFLVVSSSWYASMTTDDVTLEQFLTSPVSSIRRSPGNTNGNPMIRKSNAQVVEDDDDEEGGDEDRDDDDSTTDTSFATAMILPPLEPNKKGTEGHVRVSYEQMLERDPTFRVSPFEWRWSGFRLPLWVQKANRAQLAQSPVVVPPGKHVCFVHVGKAAGSTIGCSLGFSLHCEEGMVQPPGQLSRYATNMFHNQANDCAEHMPYYLYTLRSPVDRIKSAYVYDREDAELVLGQNEWMQRQALTMGEYDLYYGCRFWTINDLVNHGLASDGLATPECKKLAYRTIRGKEQHGNHLFYNYQYYTSQTITATPSSSSPDKSKILVIRSEHAVQDWNTIEKVVAPDSPDEVVHEFPRSNKQKSLHKTDKDSILSDSSRLLLCEALCEEIQIYKKLLYHAVNLNAKDFSISMDELYQSCPIQARADECPEEES